MVAQTFEKRDPKSLKNHLLSIKIYGQEKPTAEFLESIETHGVLVPLLILPDGTIIAGHTRKFAAVLKNLKEVPCVVRHDLEDQPMVVERLVILSNRQRVKTGDVIAREASALAAIESALAEKREKSGVKPNPSPEPGEGLAGRTDTKIGAALGIGKHKAAQAIRVGDAIQKAEDAGDTKKAEAIKATARESIPKADRLVSPKRPAAKAVDSLDDDAKEIERSAAGLKGTLERAEDLLAKLFNAVDRKKKTNSRFATKRHAKFEKVLRELGELISDCQTHCTTVETLWTDTKLQGLQ